MKKISTYTNWYFIITLLIGVMIGLTYFVIQRSDSTSKQENEATSQSPSLVTEYPSAKPTTKSTNKPTKKPGKIAKRQSVHNEITGKYEPIEDVTGYIDANKISWKENVRPEVPTYLSEELYDANNGIDFNYDAGSDKENPDGRGDYARDVLKKLPTEAMREGEDQSYVYTMYDTEVGVRLYLFFSKEKHNYKYVDGFPVNMSSKLSYQDYKHLKSGDFLEYVLVLEPAIEPIFSRSWKLYLDFEVEKMIKKGQGPTSIHILTDGVLKIEYNRNADGKYVITNITYAEDYVLDGLDGKTCYRIHPNDFVE